MKKLIFISIILFELSAFCQILSASNDDFNISIVQEKIKVQQVTTIKSLYFESNKSILNENSLESLKTILGVLVDNPEMNISLNAYSDVSETEKNLSLKRAIAAKKYLVTNGILASRLTIKDFSNTKQLSEINAEQYERRVDFEIE